MFDSEGYLASRPLRPENWKSVVSELPNGLVLTANSVPPGFFLMQNFLNSAVCDAIVNECERLLRERHTVANREGADETVQSTTRSSDYIDTRALSININEIIRHAYGRLVGPHFGKQIDWFELPEILRYSVGGEYKPHADAENWKAATQKWERVIDRDLSVLIYLNEGYTGGEIVFPNFGVTLQPKRGLLIAFPSDARYLHTARPVTAGVRYALVSWAAAKGTMRTSPEPRPHSIRM